MWKIFSLIFIILSMGIGFWLFKQPTQQALISHVPEQVQKQVQIKPPTNLLHPYQRFEELTDEIHLDKQQQIADYLTEYADSPLAPKLRQQWLYYLAEQQEWKLVQEYYQPTSNSALRCLYLTALYYNGHRTLVMNQVKNLWLVPYSQPKQCNFLFKTWQQKNQLTTKLIWQRLELVLSAKNRKLARYLIKQLNEKQQIVAKLWLRVDSNPRLITKLKLPKTKYTNFVIAHGLTRLALRSPSLSAKTYEILSEKYSLTEDNKQQIIAAIALSYALKAKPESRKWFAQLKNPVKNSVVREWRIRSALLHQDWPTLKTSIEALPESERQQSNWQYWYAKALAKTGEKEKAKQLLKSLAEQRNYYGFLASSELGKTVSLNHQVLPIAEDKLTAINNLAGINRAKLFYQEQDLHAARKEWYHTMRMLSDDDKYIAAKLAASWGWHSQGILTGKDATHKDDLILRFPLVYQELINKVAKKHKINPAFIFAIIRQESSFQPDARSRAGALGLMQLLPSTARLHTKKQKIKLRKTSDILKIKNNLHLGSAHVRSMLKRFKNNYVFVAIAYNAGSKPLGYWRKRNITDLSIWIETLPWRETRRYLKNVLTYFVIYEHRLGNKVSLHDILNKR